MKNMLLIKYVWSSSYNDVNDDDNDCEDMVTMAIMKILAQNYIRKKRVKWQREESSRK